jgi:hypothetical protein
MLPLMVIGQMHNYLFVNAMELKQKQRKKWRVRKRAQAKRKEKQNKIKNPLNTVKERNKA